MKKLLAIALILAIGLSPIFPSFAVGVPTEKDEVVYGLLNLDGSVEEIYVVNSFKGGSITDYGDYSWVNNMSSSEDLNQEGDTITIDTKGDSFFYQGTLETKKLPWNVEIAYQLDKKEISISELAGKSGDLSITLITAPNTAVNGAFFENYMLQVSLMLDTDKCTSISSPRATLANAGKNKVITHTVMPGENANIIITAKVKDFSMSGFEITALPLSMSIELPDTEGLTQGMTELSEGVDSLNEGVGKLSDGIDKSHMGIQKLNVGSTDFGNGLSQLNGNSVQIITASGQIKQALNSISAGLEAGSFNMDEITQLPATLRGLAGGLDQVSTGMGSLKAGYSTAYAALGAKIGDIPSEVVDPTTLYTAIGGDADLNEKLDKLIEYYAAAKTVKATYDGVKAAFDAVEYSLNINNPESLPTSINGISGGLSAIADEIEHSLSGTNMVVQLQQLKAGLAQLSAQYGQFHAGLDQYTGGVARLSGNYGEFDAGLKAFTSGIGELNNGGKELYKGSEKLNEAVAELPSTIKTEIDKIASQYDKSDFVPVSFVSDKNTKVTAVQFVIKTGAIEAPEGLQPENEVPAKLNFWQKLLKLFGL